MSEEFENNVKAVTTLLKLLKENLTKSEYKKVVNIIKREYNENMP